jgi:hypothetical protein
MHRLVLAPAHMQSSTYEQDLPPALAARAATAYVGSGEPVPGGHHLYPEMAPAGLWTTPSDLARFAITLQASVAGGPNPLLGKTSVDAMMTRTLNNWGLGVDLGPAGGSAMFEHSGDNAGFHADLIAFTGGERQGVAIMTNGDGGSALVPEIVRAVAKSYGWGIDQPELVRLAAVSPRALAELAGVYEIPGLATLTVTADSDKLYVFAPALSPEHYELLPRSPTTFFIVENGMTGEFHRGADGAVSGLTLSGPLGSFQAIRKP